MCCAVPLLNRGLLTAEDGECGAGGVLQRRFKALGIGAHRLRVHGLVWRCRCDLLQRDSFALAGSAHRGVDQFIELSYRHHGGHGQASQIPAAQRGALARAQDHLHGRAVDPARPQSPGTAHALGHVAGLLARRSREPVESLRDLLSEDLPEGCITRRALSHALRQLRDGSIRGILDGADAEFHAEVNEQLVAAGGYAFHEGFDGISRRDLVGADLGPQRNKHLEGLVHAQREVLDGGRRLLTGCLHGFFLVCPVDCLPRLRFDRFRFGANRLCGML